MHVPFPVLEEFSCVILLKIGTIPEVTLPQLVWKSHIDHQENAPYIFLLLIDRVFVFCIFFNVRFPFSRWLLPLSSWEKAEEVDTFSSWHTNHHCWNPNLVRLIYSKMWWQHYNVLCQSLLSLWNRNTAGGRMGNRKTLGSSCGLQRALLHSLLFLLPLKISTCSPHPSCSWLSI